MQGKELFSNDLSIIISKRSVDQMEGSEAAKDYSSPIEARFFSNLLWSSIQKLVVFKKNSSLKNDN